MQIKRKKLFLLLRAINGQYFIEGYSSDIACPIEFQCFNVHFQEDKYLSRSLKLPVKKRFDVAVQYTEPTVVEDRGKTKLKGAAKKVKLPVKVVKKPKYKMI